MNDLTAITKPGEQVVWGYIIPADFVGKEVFSPCEHETEAREWVKMSAPGARKLAKRTLGPVELVEE